MVKKKLQRLQAFHRENAKKKKKGYAQTKI
jgi:hypothetical protein